MYSTSTYIFYDLSHYSLCYFQQQRHQKRPRWVLLDSICNGFWVFTAVTVENMTPAATKSVIFYKILYAIRYTSNPAVYSLLFLNIYLYIKITMIARSIVKTLWKHYNYYYNTHNTFMDTKYNYSGYINKPNII